MNICIVSPDYPDKLRADYSFVQKLVEQIADIEGIKCFVIAPYSITKNRRITHKLDIQYSPKGNIIKIYRPNFISFSNLKIGNTYISNYFKEKAILKTLNKIPEKIDVIYGHFWESGMMSYLYAKEKNIPLFVATGESKIPEYLNDEKFDSFRKYVRGVICVSTKNKNESIKLGLTTEDRCEVIPNAIDSSKFKILDKRECRKNLGFPKDVFIVAFVGWFIERKGSKRLSEALKRIGDENIKSIFIGSGELEPNCDGIIFKGPLKNNQIPEYLNCADVFVLPTLKEGCCNAIIEAMACGLPIISSNLSFNWDVLNENNSIMIDPNNIDEIAKAIVKLKNSPMILTKLSEGAKLSSKNFEIKSRAKKIHNFILSKL